VYAGCREQVTTWAGSNLGKAGLEDGPVKQALFNHPGGLASPDKGEKGDVFVADTYNHAIRLITHVDGQWVGGCRP
jgi:hypothetical protein